jgi:hypothetical protein
LKNKNMAVKKAILGLDLMIQHKEKIRKDMLDPESLWNMGEPKINGMATSIASFLQGDVDYLYAIKRELLPEQARIKIVCRHPKKDHDIADGQKYCMNCNANL